MSDFTVILQQIEPGDTQAANRLLPLVYEELRRLAAQKMAAEHPGEIHLLITDVIMPGMSGRDVAKRLSERRPAIKCLFISGFTADVIAERGILDDGVHFLPKPFTREQLARKMREALA